MNLRPRNICVVSISCKAIRQWYKPPLNFNLFGLLIKWVTVLNRTIKILLYVASTCYILKISLISIKRRVCLLLTRIWYAYENSTQLNIWLIIKLINDLRLRFYAINYPILSVENKNSAIITFPFNVQFFILSVTGVTCRSS